MPALIERNDSAMSNIHPTAVIEAGAQIGENAEIGPFCVVGPNVVIGKNVRMLSHVVIMGNTTIGDDCVFYPQTVIGGTAQILNVKEGGCRLEIGNRNTFRENVTVHGSAPNRDQPTRMGDDCFMMANTHVAHDCQVGNKCVFANSAAIGGECVVGDQVWFGAFSCVHQRTWIGDHAFIGAGSILVGDVIPFATTLGNQAEVVTLNVVGLKRRGFTKSDIRAINSCVKEIYDGDASFKSNVETANEKFSDVPFAQDILKFVESDRGGRPLCQYRRGK